MGRVAATRSPRTRRSPRNATTSTDSFSKASVDKARVRATGTTVSPRGALHDDDEQMYRQRVKAMSPEAAEAEQAATALVQNLKAMGYDLKAGVYSIGSEESSVDENDRYGATPVSAKDEYEERDDADDTTRMTDGRDLDSKFGTTYGSEDHTEFERTVIYSASGRNSELGPQETNERTMRDTVVASQDTNEWTQATDCTRETGIQTRATNYSRETDYQTRASNSLDSDYHTRATDFTHYTQESENQTRATEYTRESNRGKRGKRGNSVGSRRKSPKTKHSTSTRSSLHTADSGSDSLSDVTDREFAKLMNESFDASLDAKTFSRVVGSQKRRKGLPDKNRVTRAKSSGPSRTSISRSRPEHEPRKSGGSHSVDASSRNPRGAAKSSDIGKAPMVPPSPVGAATNGTSYTAKIVESPRHGRPPSPMNTSRHSGKSGRSALLSQGKSISQERRVSPNVGTTYENSSRNLLNRSPRKSSSVPMSIPNISPRHYERYTSRDYPPVNEEFTGGNRMAEVSDERFPLPEAQDISADMKGKPTKKRLMSRFISPKKQRAEEVEVKPANGFELVSRAEFFGEIEPNGTQRIVEPETKPNKKGIFRRIITKKLRPKSKELPQLARSSSMDKAGPEWTLVTRETDCVSEADGGEFDYYTEDQEDMRPCRRNRLKETIDRLPSPKKSRQLSEGVPVEDVTLHVNKDHCHTYPISAMTMSKSEDSGDRNSAANRSKRAFRKDPSVTDHSAKESRAKVSAGIALKKGLTSRAVKKSDDEPEGISSQKSPGVVASVARTDSALCEADDSGTFSEKTGEATTVEIANHSEPIEEKSAQTTTAERVNEKQESSTVVTTTSKETGNASAKSQGSLANNSSAQTAATATSSVRLNPLETSALDYDIDAQQGNDALTSLEMPTSKRPHSRLLNLRSKVTAPKKTISGLLRKGFSLRSNNESENEINSTRQKGQGETNDENSGDDQSTMGMASAAGENPAHVLAASSDQHNDRINLKSKSQNLKSMSQKPEKTDNARGQRQSDQGTDDNIPMKDSVGIPFVSMGEKSGVTTSDSATDCTIKTSTTSVAPPLRTSGLNKRAESQAPERKKGLKKILQRRLSFSTKQPLPRKLPKDLPLRRNDKGSKSAGQKPRHSVRAEANPNDDCNSEAAVATTEGIKIEDRAGDHLHAKKGRISVLELAENIEKKNSASVPYASENRKSPSATTLEMKSVESEQSTLRLNALVMESNKRVVMMSPKTRNGVRSSLARATCGTVVVDERAQTAGKGDKAGLGAASLSHTHFQDFSSQQALLDTDNSTATVDILVRENQSVLLAPAAFRGPIDVPRSKTEEAVEGKIPNYTVCGLFGEFFSEAVLPANETDVEKKGVRFSEDLEFVREIPALSLSASETADSYNNRSVDEELSVDAAPHAGKRRLFSWLRRDARRTRNALPNIREDASSEQGSLGSVSEYSSADEDMSFGDDSTASRSTKGNENETIMTAANRGVVSNIRVDPRAAGTRDTKRVESKNGTQNANPVEARSKASLHEDEGIELIARRTKNGKNAILIAKTGGNPRYDISTGDEAQNTPKTLAVKKGAGFPPQKSVKPQVPAKPPRKESPSFRLFHSKAEKTEPNKKKADTSNQKNQAPTNPTNDDRNTVNTTDGIFKGKPSPSSPAPSGNVIGRSSPSGLATDYTEKGSSSPSGPAADNTVKGRSSPSAFAVPQKFVKAQVPAKPPRKESPSFRLFHSNAEKTEPSKKKADTNNQETTEETGPNKKKADANNQKTQVPTNPTNDDRNTVNTTDGILKGRSTPSSPVPSGNMIGRSSPSGLVTDYTEKGSSSPSGPAPDNTVKGRSSPSALAAESAVNGRVSPGLPPDDNVKGRSSPPGLTPDSNATERSSPSTLGPNTIDTSSRPTTLSENKPSQRDDQNENKEESSSMRGDVDPIDAARKHTSATASMDFSENTTDRKRGYPAERISNTKAVDESWFSWLLPEVLPAWQETEPKTKHAKEEREQLFGDLSMDSTKDDDDTTSQISGPSINSQSVENEAWQEILDATDTMASKFEQHQSETGDDDDNRSISDDTLEEVNDAIAKFREHAARLGVNERELMAAIRDDGSVQNIRRNDSATTASIDYPKSKKGLMSQMGNVTDQFIEMFDAWN